MPRLFTGLELPDDLADELALLRGGLSGAKWIEPDDYHITLRFIGDISDALADDVFDVLSAIRRPAMDVMLEGLMTFGGDKPRALVARVRLTPELAELQLDHERAMRRIGLAPETRKFVPHVTIARLRGASAEGAAAWLGSRVLLPRRFLAAEFHLFSSRASTGGGPYVNEASFALQRLSASAAGASLRQQPI